MKREHEDRGERKTPSWEEIKKILVIPGLAIIVALLLRLQGTVGTRGLCFLWPLLLCPGSRAQWAFITRELGEHRTQIVTCRASPEATAKAATNMSPPQGFSES